VLLNKVLVLLLYSQECCTNGSRIIYSSCTKARYCSSSLYAGFSHI
jgi:hypothetical protein